MIFDHSHYWQGHCIFKTLKTARLRQEKADEEANDLVNKQKHLEMEVDVFGEKLSMQIVEQESKEAQVLSAEAEFNRLNKR